MTFALAIEGSSDIEALRTLARESTWEIVKGRDYQTADVTDLLGEMRAFFLKLPAGGRLHRHRDAGDCVTHHVVIETNDGCLNWWADSTGEHSMHMELGKRYVVDRTLEHWAVNEGSTDRIHLLLEYKP